MKKYILSAAIIALTRVAFAQTNETPAVPAAQQEPATAVKDSTTSTKIELAALPDAVKTTLSSDAYKAWSPTEAYLVNDGGKQYYQINVTKNEEKAMLKINADGTLAS